MTGVAALPIAGVKASDTKEPPMDTRPFGLVVRDYLLQAGGDYVTGIGNPNWSRFADDIDGVHYETLRKAVAGERAPGTSLMEAVAKAMGVKPDVFYEYRLAEAQALFDPKQVGVEQAIENLELFLQARDSRPPRTRKK